MKQLIFVALVFYYSLAFCGEPTDLKAPVVQSEAYTTVDDTGIVEYHTKSKNYRFIRTSSDSFLLVLAEISETQSLGDEVPKAEIKLTGLLVKDNRIGEKIWTIERKGHKWDIDNNQIVIISKGCCDAPDRQYFYGLQTGNLNSETKK